MGLLREEDNNRVNTWSRGWCLASAKTAPSSPNYVQSPKVDVLGSPLTHISSFADAIALVDTRDRDATGAEARKGRNGVPTQRN